MRAFTLRLTLLSLFAAAPVLAVPPEVAALRFPGKVQLAWDSVAGSAGYHVYRGTVASLHAGSYGACLLGSVAATSAGVPANPPAGQAYFFLVGAFDPSGAGSIGHASSGAESIPEVPCIPSRRNFELIGDSASDGLGNAEPLHNASERSYSFPHVLERLLLHSGEVVLEESGHGSAFFRSVSGLESETETVPYRQSGGGKKKDPSRPWMGAWGYGSAARFGGKYYVAGCTHKHYRSGIRYDGPHGHGWDSTSNSRLRRSGPDMLWYDGHGRVHLLPTPGR